jgi:hypothetical protein
VASDINSEVVKYVMIYDNKQGTEIKIETRNSFAKYNNEMFGSPVLSVVKTSEIIINESEKKDSIITFLKREGIPTKELKFELERDQAVIRENSLRPGFLYIKFIGKQQNFTSGGHAVIRCPNDTLIEMDPGYGLLYNLCDYREKSKLPEVRVWGKETYNGYYTETPARAQDFYILNIISNFTVLRNDSDHIADGILIPVSKEFNERNIHLERYLPRAYKWVPADSNLTRVMIRNGRKYLFAEINQSGHYRFTHDPLSKASVICIKAPENTCFKEIILEHGTCSNWKGLVSDGKKTAYFILPQDPSTFACKAKLLDAEGNTLEFQIKQLESSSKKTDIKEKDQSIFSVVFPGHKKVKASTLFELTLDNKKHNPKISKL